MARTSGTRDVNPMEEMDDSDSVGTDKSLILESKCCLLIN